MKHLFAATNIINSVSLSPPLSSRPDQGKVTKCRETEQNKIKTALYSGLKRYMKYNVSLLSKSRVFNVVLRPPTIILIRNA